MDEKLKKFNFNREDLDFECPSSSFTFLAGRMIGKWKLIGRDLGVSDARLKSIPLDKTNITSPEEEAAAMLDAWAAEKGSEATCLKLVEVLYERTENAILEKFCEKVKPDVEKRRVETKAKDPVVPQPPSAKEERRDDKIKEKDAEQLFKDLSKPIGKKYPGMATELGVPSSDITDEVETNLLMMGPASERAKKTLQLWQGRAPKSEFTYSRLSAALVKNGLLRYAEEYCHYNPAANEQ